MDILLPITRTHIHTQTLIYTHQPTHTHTCTSKSRLSHTYHPGLFEIQKGTTQERENPPVTTVVVRVKYLLLSPQNSPSGPIRP